MIETTKPICVERILVSLDSSKHSFAALHAAIKLARYYDASLKGVFVEDIALLSLSEMPFRQEVGQYTAIVREISTDGIARGINVQSRWIVRTFQKLINLSDVTGEFAILRGNVSKTIDRESTNCDLLILGKTGTSPLLRRRLGSTTKAMIRNQKKTLLLVEEDNRLGYPMIVLYENSPLGQVSLETGMDLLDPGETLIILLNEDDPDAFEENKQKISAIASEKQINISFQSFKSHTFSRFLQLAHGIKTGLFILPHIQKLPTQRFVDLVLEEVSLPILLIRAANTEE